MVTHLIRRKSLECARFRGYVVIAVEQEVTRLPKVSDGCRKMAQYEWVELLMRMMHEVGIIWNPWAFRDARQAADVK